MSQKFMKPLLSKLNGIRDPLIVERILVGNSRTTMEILDAKDFETEEALLNTIRRLRQANRPFVIRSAGRNWKVFKRWNNPSDLAHQAKVEADSFPKRKYTVYEPEPDGHLNQSHAAPYGYMSLHKYLGCAQEKRLSLLGVPDKSGRGVSPFEIKRGEDQKSLFSDDIDSDPAIQPTIDLFSDASATRRHVFFSSAYSYTNLHYDTDWNLYLCVSGTRTWTIAHPQQAPVLGAAQGGANYSKLRPTKGIDGLQDSRLAHLVKFMRVELAAGDVLFVPPTWWHVVEGAKQGFSCAINWFFTTASMSTQSPVDIAWRGLWERDLSDSEGSESPTSDRSGNGPKAREFVSKGLAGCGDSTFCEQLRGEVGGLFKKTPMIFSDLLDYAGSDRPDSILARQMMRIVVNSCVEEGVEVHVFESLCNEIMLVIEKRATALNPGSNTKRVRYTK